MKKKKDSEEIKFVSNPSAGIGFFNSTSAGQSASGGAMGEELEEKETKEMTDKQIKKQIKEALNKIDNSCIDRRLPYYNLTGLYESANLSRKDDEDLGKVLFELKDGATASDTKKLHDMLSDKQGLQELFDLGLNIDASGQSVGILQGQGGEVHNEELDERDQKKLNELFNIDLNLDAGGQSVGILGGSGGTVTNNESLTEEVIDFDKEEIKADITNTVRESLKRKLGYDDEFIDDYVFLDTNDFTYDDGTGAIKVELRWEIGYEEGMPVVEDLNKAIQKYDPEAYFEHETATDLVALIREDQSEDVVDKEVVSDYKDLIDSASTKEEVIDVYRRADESREKGEITYATLFEISDYLEKVIDERFSDVAESLREDINQQIDKNKKISDLQSQIKDSKEAEKQAKDNTQELQTQLNTVKNTKPEEIKEEESLNESYYNIMTIGDIREGSIGNMSDEEIDLDERIFNAIGRYFHKNSNDVNVIVSDGEEVLDPKDYEEVFDSYSDNNLLGQRMKNYDIRVLHLDLNGKKYEVIREVRNGTTFLYFEDDYNANDFLDEMSAEVKRFYGESLNESADEETPYTEEEVEADLKSLTNNWTNRDGSVRSGFKEEQRHAVNVLRRHYNYVDTSYDDRPGVQLHYIVAYSSPMSIGKDSDGNIVRDVEESLKEDSKDIYMRGKEYKNADDFYAGKSADLKELENSLIGKEFDKEEVFAKLRETFNDNAISHMHPEMRTTLGLAYLIEDQTGENVMGVEWEEKDGKIVVTYIDFIDDSEVVDDDNDTLDESLNESSYQLGSFKVKNGDKDIVAEYHWDKGNTYQVTVGEYKDSIQYGSLMFDKRYYSKEDAERAFKRKVRELKKSYSDNANKVEDDLEESYFAVTSNTKGIESDLSYHDTKEEAEKARKDVLKRDRNASVRVVERDGKKPDFSSDDFTDKDPALKEDVETISDSPMYAYLVTSDMTDNTFALIHKDRSKVENETGQRMFDQFVQPDDPEQAEKDFDRIVSELQKDGYYIGTDDDMPSPWVEITDWDWEEEENTGNWTAVINRQEIPLKVVNKSHWRF